MAVISQFNQEDKDKDKPSLGVSTSGTISTPGVTAATPGTSGMVPQKGLASSGQFTNVNKFIEANRGAGTKLADRSTQDISRNIAQTRGNINENFKAFGSDVQNEEDRITEKNVLEADRVRAAIQADPTKLTADTTRFGQARDLITGKNAAVDQTKALKAQEDAATTALGQSQQQLQNLGTETGRFNLLRKTVGGPSYSQGQQRLDQLLFQTEGASRIGQAQNQFGTELRDTAANKLAEANRLRAQIGNYSELARAKAGELTGELNTQQDLFEKDQDKEAAALNRSRLALNQAMGRLRDSGADTLTENDRAVLNPILQSAGVDMGMRTYGLLGDSTYKNYFKTGRDNLTRQDVIDKADLARYTALADLQALQNKLYTKEGDRGPDSSLDAAQLKKDADARRTQLEQDLNRVATARLGNLASGSTNLKDLLLFKEGNRASDAFTPMNLTQYLNRGGQVNYNNAEIRTNQNNEARRAASENPEYWKDAYISDLGGYIAGGSDLGFESQVAGNLWQQLQTALGSANYYENLGRKDLTRGLEPTKVKKQV